METLQEEKPRPESGSGALTASLFGVLIPIVAIPGLLMGISNMRKDKARGIGSSGTTIAAVWIGGVICTLFAFGLLTVVAQS